MSATVATLRNEFHGRTATVIVQAEGFTLTRKQMRRISDKLCGGARHGSHRCRCGIINGPQGFNVEPVLATDHRGQYSTFRLEPK